MSSWGCIAWSNYFYNFINFRGHSSSLLKWTEIAVNVEFSPLPLQTTLAKSPWV
jgi:hypothetical protein